MASNLWHSELQIALQAADEASEVLTYYFGRLKEVSEKPGAGLVSEADRESERVIGRALKKAFPSYEMLGEESGQSAWTKGQSKGLWIVDPLDGTTNYVRRFPFFAISIGLMVEKELVLGVVKAPMLGQTFWATKGGGAFCNGESIRVTNTNRIADSFMATGFYYQKGTTLKQQVAVFHGLLSRSSSIRRAGAAALDLAFVAAGVFDGFWEADLSAWDTAAGAVLVTEAGGKVSDYAGNAFDVNGNSLLASNGVMHDLLVAEIQQNLVPIK